MKINLCGVRGSIPTTAPENQIYGGQTSCTLVSEDDDLLVLDAGSGIQAFNNKDISRHKRVDVLLTHLHLDHIQGLGFFRPLFIPDMDVHIWGPSSTQSLHSRISRYLSPPLFPVLIRDLPCKLTLHEVGNSSFEIGHFNIQSSYVIHPGPTLGYRVKGNESVFTYIPDHEPALGKSGIIKNTKWTSGFDIALDADLIYHDGQYTDKEYSGRRGWGHSGIGDVMQFAAIAGVKHLLIGHHDPVRTDSQLTEIEAALKKSNAFTFDYEFAIEGKQFDLL
ncbi:MAG TPA: MBL fold metallo-hydrolase [Chryseolinea sp.]|nr:MBL fold metallo-hydrolase [Chryseolinea sp.]